VGYAGCRDDLQQAEVHVLREFMEEAATGAQTCASFSDPDGNGWQLQEIKTRLPGREWEG
jgi:hypothetical protein